MRFAVRNSILLALAFSSFPVLVACGGSDPAPITQPPPVMNGPLPTIVSTGPVKPVYPAAPKKSVTDSYGNLHVADDYRWLEDTKDPNVALWSDAENAFARKILDT